MRTAVLMMLITLIPGCGAQAADLVLFGGRVLTQGAHPAQKPPTAVAIADGIILAVGSDDEILALKGAQTESLDLRGATLVPGFIDSHAHLCGLGKSLVNIDLRGTASPAGVADLVQEEAAQFPPDTWVEGRGWDQNDWDVPEYPHRSRLDAIIPDRPVLLRRIDGHAAWVNSETLRRAGINTATPDPEGGAILRDSQGEATGILIDNAVKLVLDIMPAVGPQETRRRIRRATEHCLAKGVTGVHEAGITWEQAMVYRDMAANGDLGIRVYAMYEDTPATLDRALPEGPILTENDMLTIRAIKLYTDGALGSRGALLLEDYTDQQGHRGLPVTSAEHMRQVALTGGRAGFQICAHAIGDGGNRLVLDLFAEILPQLDQTDTRWRVEHAQILDPADIPRFAELGVIAAMQPTHCTSDMDWADERLGQDRLAGAYAWRSLLDAGAQLCFGTDFPVEKVDPLAGLYAARTRTHQDGTPLGGWQPQERLDGATALALYTRGSAWAGFQEKQLGRVQTGYRADLTVLDGDPTAADPATLLDLRVLMTLVDGKVVYRRP